MRAASLVLLLVLAVPPAQAIVLSSYYSEVPGWRSLAFTADSYPRITVSYGIDSDDELSGGVVALFDGAGNAIASAVLGAEGGRLVDASVRSGNVVFSTEDTGGPSSGGAFEQSLTFTCDATCNPSRAFKLLVSGGGELNAWGYGLIVRAGTRGASLTGADAWAVPSRDFEGAALVRPALGGVAYAQGSTYDLTVPDALYGAWFKPSSNRPEDMRIASPGGDIACDCLVTGTPAGAYRLHYTDIDAMGTEAFFVATNARLP